MRDILVGIRRFDELAEDLGLSRKTLTARLARLVEEGVLTRRRYQTAPPREEYVATEKGRELYPVLLALMAWGDKWYAGPAGPPARIRHDACGHLATPVVACDACREPLTAGDTTQLPGPGGRVGPGTRLLGLLIAARGRRARNRLQPRIPLDRLLRDLVAGGPGLVRPGVLPGAGRAALGGSSGLTAPEAVVHDPRPSAHAPRAAGSSHRPRPGRPPTPKIVSRARGAASRMLCTPCS